MPLTLDLNKSIGTAKKEAGAQLILNLNKAGNEELGRALTRQDAKSRVAIGMDVSGSTADLYKDGYMGLIMTMCGGIALNLDDNGDLDVFAFDSKIYELPGFTAKNADTYVADNLYSPRNRGFRVGGGGTSYSAFLRQLMKKYGPGDPVFAILISDGENQDQQDSINALVDLSYHGPIFVQTVGVGYSSGVTFSNLEELNTLGTVTPEPPDEAGPRFIDNAGFCTADFKHATEAELYAALMNEYPNFLAKAMKRGFVPWKKSPIGVKPNDNGGRQKSRWGF